MAQTPTGPPSANTAGSLVFLLRGVPLSVEQIEEHTQKLPDGNSKTAVTRSKIYRDSDGRMRTEINIKTPSGEIVLTTIADPVAGFVAALIDGPTKTAHRMMAPKTDLPSGIGTATAGILMAGKNRKIEKLGTRMIEGIDCEGTRTTVTSDGPSPLISVDERWVSIELGLTALVEATSPDVQYSARILKVTGADPDPGLFVIPQEYEIHELGDLSNN